jgi:hypothetical protein
VSDLSYTHGVDVAITYSDDLDQYKKSYGVKNIDQRINYIYKLYEEELHIYARIDLLRLSPSHRYVRGMAKQGHGAGRPWTDLNSGQGDLWRQL